jgi:hypothetical protein
LAMGVTARCLAMDVTTRCLAMDSRSLEGTEC